MNTNRLAQIIYNTDLSFHLVLGVPLVQVFIPFLFLYILENKSMKIHKVIQLI